MIKLGGYFWFCKKIGNLLLFSCCRSNSEVWNTTLRRGGEGRSVEGWSRYRNGTAQGALRGCWGEHLLTWAWGGGGEARPPRGGDAFFLFFLENAGYSTKLQLKKKQKQKGWLRPSQTYFMITQWFTSCRVTGTALGSEGNDEGFYQSDWCSQNCDGGSCSGWWGGQVAREQECRVEKGGLFWWLSWPLLFLKNAGGGTAPIRKRWC